MKRSTLILLKTPPFLLTLFKSKKTGAFFDEIASLYDLGITNKIPLSHFEQLPLQKNQAAFVIDLTRNDIVFTKNFENIGVENRKINLDFIKNTIHPDDLEMVKKISKAAIIYSLAFAKSSKNNELSIAFRLKNRHDLPLRVLAEAEVAGLDKNGKIISVFVTITDISSFDKSDKIIWKFKSRHFNKSMFEKLIYKSGKKP